MYLLKTFIVMIFGGIIFSIMLSSCTSTRHHSSTKHKIIQKKKNVKKISKNIKLDNNVDKIHWPFSISYDSDCPIRFSDAELKEIVDRIPLEKNRIIRNMFVNSPDTVSVWIVPTTTFYSGKERTYFLLKTDSGKWIVK